jgi:hypothetical protein
VYCVEVAREEEVADPEATENALDTIGAILEIMAQVSDAHDDCHGHHSKSSHNARPHNGSHHRHRKPKMSVVSAAVL